MNKIIYEKAVNSMIVNNINDEHFYFMADVYNNHTFCFSEFELSFFDEEIGAKILMRINANDNLFSIISVNGHKEETPLMSFYPTLKDWEPVYKKRAGSRNEDLFGQLGFPIPASGDDYQDIVDGFIEWLKSRDYSAYNLVLYCCRTALYIMGDIMFEISKRKEEIRKNKKTLNKKWSREHRISTENQKVYLLDDVIKYACDKYISENGHHNVTCPCWEVRGHYRHYKSGKVVFVKSFQKGKQRNKALPKEKEYIL